MEPKFEATEEDIALGVCLDDELLFLLLFWSDDLTKEMSVEQKLMACDRSKKVLVCTGRKIAKTIVIESKVTRLGISHTREGAGVTEALMFTPRDSQLAPIIDRIYGRVNRTPFLKAFVTEQRRGDAPRLTFSTGLTWYFRIEGISGTDQNMVGLRAQYILGDECAYGNDVCHTSRIQTALPDADWWYSGVPNGWRGSPFYRLDQTKAGEEWSKHKYETYVNPIYQYEGAEEELTKAYGGKQTQGYQTQVLGQWGDELISSFPPGAIAMGSQPYFTKTLTSALRNDDTAIAVALGLPAVRANTFCVGWDYGYSPDPTVILIAYSREIDRWECYARIAMYQVALPVQCRVVRYLYNHIMQGGLGALCCDSADAIQTLRADDPKRAEKFFQTVPGGTMQMTDENGNPVFEVGKESGKPEAVLIRVKQYLTERFRIFMLNHNLAFNGQKLVLGNDTEMSEELAGTTERKTLNYVVYYGPPDPNASGKMLDHNTDAGRQLADAILHVTEKRDEDASEASLIEAMGWGGEVGGWKAPW